MVLKTRHQKENKKHHIKKIKKLFILDQRLLGHKRQMNGKIGM